MLENWVYNQTDTINTVGSGIEFEQIIEEINAAGGALCESDNDNTLLITNDNKFGSDWWFAQTELNFAFDSMPISRAISTLESSSNNLHQVNPVPIRLCSPQAK